MSWRDVIPPIGGFPKNGYTRQLPPELPSVVTEKNLSHRLPCHLREQGFELLEIKPVERGRDPYVLYNPWGEIMAIWEQLLNLGEFYLYGSC